MSNTETIVIDDPEGIALARLITLKQAVRLEATGMRHSSGKSMRKEACKELSMRLNSTHDDVIGALVKEIDKRMKKHKHQQLEELRASARKPPHHVESQK